MTVEVRYLSIRWRHENVVERVCEISRDPCRVVMLEGRRACYSVETTAYPKIFEASKDSCGIYIGFYFSDLPENKVPVVILADQSSAPLFQVPSEFTDGKQWWIRIDDWLKKGGYHQSLFHKRVGEIEVRAGAKTLLVRNAVSNFTMEDYDRLISSFGAELMELILSESSPVRSEKSFRAGSHVGDLSGEFLSKFVQAVNKIKEKPNVALIETVNTLPRNKVKPIRDTFKQYSVNPGRHRFISRTHEETLDTKENRYIHYLVDRVRSILMFTSSFLSIGVQSAIVRDRHLKNQLANTSLETQHVDEELFRGQQQREIDDLNKEIDLAQTLDRQILESLGKEFGGKWICADNQRKPLISLLNVKKSDLFNPDGTNKKGLLGVDSKSFILNSSISGEFYDLWRGWLSSRDRFRFFFDFSGECTSERKVGETTDLHIKNVDCSSIYVDSVSPLMSDLGELKKKHYEEVRELSASGWNRPLTPSEREVNEEAIRQLKEFQQKNTKLHTHLKKSQKTCAETLNKILKIGDFFKSNHVMKASTAPFSMVMSMNRRYVDAVSTYKDFLNTLNLSDDMLNGFFELQKFGLTDVWNIYEKWCLVRIVKALISLNYVPEKNGRSICLVL